MEPNVLNAINNQINEELNSYYLYASMACYLRYNKLRGFSKWMMKQADEELAHAGKLADYLHNRAQKVELKQINTPKQMWGSPTEIMQDALEHERFITGKISSLIDLAREEGDHMTFNMLQWFIGEQVEEECKIREILDRMTIAGDYMSVIDHDLGEMANKP